MATIDENIGALRLLLKARHFDNHGLNLPGQLPRFLQSTEQELHRLNADKGRTELDTPFSVSVMGFYQQKTLPVEFKFNFRYSAEEDLLFLKSMEASLFTTRHEFQINGVWDLLPTPKEIALQLYKSRQKEEKRVDKVINRGGHRRGKMPGRGLKLKP